MDIDINQCVLLSLQVIVIIFVIQFDEFKVYVDYVKKINRVIITYNVTFQPLRYRESKKSLME